MVWVLHPTVFGKAILIARQGMSKPQFNLATVGLKPPYQVLNR
jgi:hypothetical protein